MEKLDGFHVIAVVSNPIQYQSRYRLFDIFSEDITRKGAKLWTLEMQTGRRAHRITDPNNPSHLQLWNSALPGEVWHKENLINLAIQFLTQKDPSWRKIAWVDADVKFELGALEKTADALDHWDVVQMWSHAVDMGPEDEIVGSPHKSFMYCHWNKIEVKSPNSYIQGGHPGFAWAARRDSLNKLGTSMSGPILDFAVLGSGDRHMACGLIGKVMESVHGDMHPNYHKWLQLWQDRAERTLHRNVGYVSNTIRHLWHGRKADRGYASRWKILVEHQFDPETDLRRDVSGLWALIGESARQRSLRDDIRRYFRARREDASTA